MNEELAIEWMDMFKGPEWENNKQEILVVKECILYETKIPLSIQPVFDEIVASLCKSGWQTLPKEPKAWQYIGKIEELSILSEIYYKVW